MSSGNGGRGRSCESKISKVEQCCSQHLFFVEGWKEIPRVNNPRGGGCHAPARPYAPVSKPGLLDEGRVPRGVQGRAGA